MNRGVLAAAAAVFSCAPAMAATHTYSFGGYVTADRGVPTGARFTGSFTWDDAAPRELLRCDEPGVCATYFKAVTEFNYSTTSGFSGAYSGPGLFTSLWDGFHGGDLFGFQPNIGDEAFYTGQLADAQLALEGSPKGLFGSPPVLPTALNLADFDGFRVFQVGTGSGTINGIVDTLFEGTIAAVPEPATWAMMIAGFGLLGAAARRRKVVFA